MDHLIEDALGRDASQLAAEEKQRLMSRLLSRLAHEIRNPLGSLDIHVQLLEEDLAGAAAALDPKVNSRLETIRTELRRLDSIVRQFVSLAGPSAVNLQPVSVEESLRHVCQLLGAEAASRRIALQAAIAPNLPEVWADPVQVTQALVNLIINAIQAVEHDGAVEVIAAFEPDAEAVVLTVRDTGPGIDPEKRLAVFEPFFTTKPEGSGLGLWIVQQIAMAHGGRVAANNAPGGGAVFTLRLPRRPKEANL